MRLFAVHSGILPPLGPRLGTLDTAQAYRLFRHEYLPWDARVRPRPRWEAYVHLFPRPSGDYAEALVARTPAFEHVVRRRLSSLDPDAWAEPLRLAQVLWQSLLARHGIPVP